MLNPFLKPDKRTQLYPSSIKSAVTILKYQHRVWYTARHRVCFCLFFLPDNRKADQGHFWTRLPGPQIQCWDASAPFCVRGRFCKRSCPFPGWWNRRSPTLSYHLLQVWSDRNRTPGADSFFWQRTILPVFEKSLCHWEIFSSADNCQRARVNCRVPEQAAFYLFWMTDALRICNIKVKDIFSLRKLFRSNKLFPAKTKNGNLHRSQGKTNMIQQSLRRWVQELLWCRVFLCFFLHCLSLYQSKNFSGTEKIICPCFFSLGKIWYSKASPFRVILNFLSQPFISQSTE